MRKSSYTYVLEALSERHVLLNPYIEQFLSVMDNSKAVTTRLFSWTDALLGRFDILHVHWPEVLYSGRNVCATFAKVALLEWLWLVVRVRQNKVVWTVHNLSPHESLSNLQKWADGRFQEHVTDVILINEDPKIPGSVEPEVRKHTILHGDYRSHFPEPLHRDPNSRLIAIVGQVRPYKGIEDFVGAMTQHSDARVECIIAGKAASDGYARQIQDAVGSDERIYFQNEFLSDDQMHSILSQSALIVLPYHAMYNSGVAILALTLKRPILVPRSISTEKLRAEVGKEWVHVFDPPFTPEDFVLAVNIASSEPKGEPNLESRNWEKQAQTIQHIFADGAV